MSIQNPDGSLWGLDIIGPVRAEKLHKAFEAIASRTGDTSAEKAFDGAPRTIDGWREAASWAAREHGYPYTLLVDALK